MMKKSSFVVMILGVIGGILFALGMCMALIPEWDAFVPGVVMGAAGVLVLLICDGQYDKLEELYDFYKKIKLPTKLKDIEVSFEELGPVMEKALSVGEIKHVPYEISGEMLYNSIKELEKYNEEREQ